MSNGWNAFNVNVLMCVNRQYSLLHSKVTFCSPYTFWNQHEKSNKGVCFSLRSGRATHQGVSCNVTPEVFGGCPRQPTTTSEDHSRNEDQAHTQNHKLLNKTQAHIWNTCADVERGARLGAHPKLLLLCLCQSSGDFPLTGALYHHRSALGLEEIIQWLRAFRFMETYT